MPYKDILSDTKTSLDEKLALLLHLEKVTAIDNEFITSLIQNISHNRHNFESIQLKALIYCIPYLTTNQCLDAIQIMKLILAKSDLNKKSQLKDFFKELPKACLSANMLEITQIFIADIDSCLINISPKNLSYLKTALQFLGDRFHKGSEKEQQLIFYCVI